MIRFTITSMIQLCSTLDLDGREGAAEREREARQRPGSFGNGNYYTCFTVTRIKDDPLV